MSNLDEAFYNIGFMVATILLTVVLVVLAIGLMSLMFSLYCKLYRMLSLDYIVFKVDEEVRIGEFGNYIRKKYNLSKIKRGVVYLTNKSKEELEEIRSKEKRDKELKEIYRRKEV